MGASGYGSKYRIFHEHSTIYPFMLQSLRGVMFWLVSDGPRLLIASAFTFCTRTRRVPAPRRIFSYSLISFFVTIYEEAYRTCLSLLPLPIALCYHPFS